MEQSVIFEEKVYLSPKDMNDVAKYSVEMILLKHMQNKIENRCSQHGFVIPHSLTMLSRSMGQLENGRFTGNVIFHVQAEGKVYNPANGTRVTGTILKKNKMGLYVIYKDAIRILVPRDLHLGNDAFEALEVNDSIDIEIRKSRFQIRDPFILSVGIFIGRSGAVTEEQTEPDAAEQDPTVASGSTTQNDEVEPNDLLGQPNANESESESEDEEDEEDEEEEDE